MTSCILLCIIYWKRAVLRFCPGSVRSLGPPLCGSIVVEDKIVESSLYPGGRGELSTTTTSTPPPLLPIRQSQRRSRGDEVRKGASSIPSMAVGGLLRGLVPPAAWLPCHELFASWHHWLPSLPRLRPPASDGFKLLLVLLLFSAALAEVRYIASSSMAPTLQPGDRAVAEKVTYLFQRPSIGDIVFFKVPTAVQNYGVNKDVVFIKRVMAIPGDFIEVRQGQLIVNGVAQKEHYTASHALCTMEAMRLPEGHVFVMGDNRNNSCDSRAWGPLPIGNIVGRYMTSFRRSSFQ